MKKVKSNREKILGLATVMTSTGFDGGDGSETTITIKDTTVWSGYRFSLSRGGLTIRADGDLELQDLMYTFRFLADEIEKLEEEN